MMDKVIEGRYLLGFTIGNSENSLSMISHLPFADDTMIFCEVDPNQILHLRYVFTWFEAVSGLKVNMGKSELVPVGDVHNLEELVSILGCKMLNLSMKYLGLPWGAKFKAKTIETKLWRRWKED